jgi:predicted nucleotidyltransferase
MVKALAQRRKERQKAIDLAMAYVHRLKKELTPLCALVCGSYARGDFHDGSDIDVLIISDALPNHPLERMNLLYRHVEENIEPRGYTRHEFSTRLDKRDMAAVEALQRGVILADDGFLRAASKSVKAAPVDG